MRYMLCKRCGHQWVVDLDWIERWDQAQESCPTCGVTCEAEDGPRLTVDPADPALVAEVSRLAWYHTSTQADWPTTNFHPAAKLTERTKLMMGGDKPVAEWAERQRSKALHVGTYEAAVHNMLRRIDDEGDRGKQFYLYRVHLRPTVIVREGWIIDPSNFVGDVALNEICPPGIDVSRYLNHHEDPGGISLALGRPAIDYIQQLEIPPLDAADANWVAYAVTALESATASALSPTGRREFKKRNTPTPGSKRAFKIPTPLTAGLPVNLRFPFRAAISFNDTMEPGAWARYAAGLLNVFLAPEQLLAKMNSQSPLHL